MFGGMRCGEVCVCGFLGRRTARPERNGVCTTSTYTIYLCSMCKGLAGTSVWGDMFLNYARRRVDAAMEICEPLPEHGQTSENTYGDDGPAPARGRLDSVWCVSASTCLWICAAGHACSGEVCVCKWRACMRLA